MDCAFFVAIILIASSLLAGENYDLSTIIWGLAGGLGFGAAYTILWRSANLMTSNLGINVIRYFSMDFTVAWLCLLGRMDDVGLWLLVSGAAVIIVANVGIYAGGIRLFGLRRPIGRRRRRFEEAIE